MGLLQKLFGGGNPNRDTLIPWLEDADGVYRRTFKTRRGDGLTAYFTAKCISLIMEKVRLGIAIDDGIERYMNIHWNKIGETDEGDIYEKVVEHDHIRMAHGVTVPVGDDYTERWLVVYDDKDKNLIADVRRLSDV